MRYPSDWMIRWTNMEHYLRNSMAEGDESSVDHVISLLRDEDWGVKHQAIVTLGNLGGEEAVNALVASLVYLHEDAGIGNQWRLYHHNLPTLKKSLRDEFGKPLRLGLRAQIIESIVNLNDRRAVPPLVAFLNSEDKELRYCSMRILGRLGDERAVEPLIVMMNSAKNKEERKNVQVALANIGEVAVEPVTLAFKDERLKPYGQKSRLVTIAFAEVLGEIGDERAVGPLQDAIKDNNTKGSAAAAKALRKILHTTKFRLSEKTE